MTATSVEHFGAVHWSVAPLLRRAAELPGDGFSDLLSLTAVDELISRRGLRTPFVRMTRDGNVLLPRRFTSGGGAGAEIADQVADEKVLAEFAAGATLVLQGLHRIWPPVMDFAVELSSQLGHPVQINAYLSPPNSTGFLPHYDVHDVFVLQFAGRKQWRVHEPVWPLPLRDQPWDARKAAVAARAAQAPLIETVLECGDALYLPRGYIHAAKSLGEIAGHLTVGVHPLTRRTLADEVFAALAEDVALRRALPIGGDLSDTGVLATDLDATIAALRRALETVDRDAVARGIGRRLAVTTRPASLRPIEQFATAAVLAFNTVVRLRPGLRVRLRLDGDDLVIELPENELRLPAAVAEAVRLAVSGAAIAAVDLPGADPEEGVKLLQELLRNAIVVPA